MVRSLRSFIFLTVAWFCSNLWQEFRSLQGCHFVEREDNTFANMLGVIGTFRDLTFRHLILEGSYVY